MKKIICGLLSAAAIVPFSAQAQFAKPEKAREYREAVFDVMGTHFSRIRAVVNGDKPYDKADVQRNAEIVAMMSKLPWDAFGPGTEGGHAKAEIWSNAAKFKEGQDKMLVEIAKLESAAKSGDLNAIKAAFGAAGQTCKSCHDSFKQKH